MLRPAALLSISIVATVGAALTSPLAAAAAGTEKEARALFQRAEMSFNLGKFPEALTDYQAAYEAKPLPGFLFNIAQCYRNMGNYERARFFYRRYLALEPRTSNRRLVEDLIAEMTRLLDKQAANAAVAPAPTSTSPADAATTPATSDPDPTSRAGGPTAVGEPAALLVAAPAAEAPPRRRPVYKRWWFWAAAAAVVGGGVVAAFALARSGQQSGSLPPIDGR
jgi:tetratricopeptide (TPR) repeat protein